MKIVDAKVIVCCPGRNFVTLKILTEDGIYGLGDATLNGRELAVASYLEDHIVPLLIGRDARKLEDTWHYLYKGAYWRRGPVTMTAIAAVDTALWDIQGKALNVPVYRLLGGPAREEVMVYGHANGETIDDTVAAAAEYVRLGYKAVRAQCGIPGVPNAYGVARGKLNRVGEDELRSAEPIAGGAEPVRGVRFSYEPAEKGKPLETAFSAERYLNVVPQLFAKLRDELGPDVHLLHDVHHRLTPIEAARLGKALEPYHLFWMEDPVPAELQESFRLISQHTTTPLAVGEVFSSIHDCQQLIEEQLIDLHPHHRRARGRHHPPAPDRPPGRAVPRAHRLPRRDRSVAGLHGGGAALRSLGPQLRDPGVHAPQRGDRSGLPGPLPVRERRDAPGRHAGPRRRHRRDAGREVPLRPGLPADLPEARRHRPQLVSTGT